MHGVLVCACVWCVGVCLYAWCAGVCLRGVLTLFRRVAVPGGGAADMGRAHGSAHDGTECCRPGVSISVHVPHVDQCRAPATLVHIA